MHHHWNLICQGHKCEKPKLFFPLHNVKDSLQGLGYKLLDNVWLVDRPYGSRGKQALVECDCCFCILVKICKWCSGESGGGTHSPWTKMFSISSSFSENLAKSYAEQWIQGSVVNFICETKSVSKQDVLIMVTWPSKVVQWTETMLYKLATFPCILWVVGTPGESRSLPTGNPRSTPVMFSISPFERFSVCWQLFILQRPIACTGSEYLDLSTDPATSRNCTVCSEDLLGKHQLRSGNAGQSGDHFLAGISERIM